MWCNLGIVLLSELYPLFQVCMPGINMLTSQVHGVVLSHFPNVLSFILSAILCAGIVTAAKYELFACVTLQAFSTPSLEVLPTVLTLAFL